MSCDFDQWASRGFILSNKVVTDLHKFDVEAKYHYVQQQQAAIDAKKAGSLILFF
ncbi:MAG: hypothetical protein QM497_04395 [Sulfurimonas sp.]